MLRAREPQLLNAERAQRMLDAPGFEEAAKLLTDCGYPDMAQMKADEIERTLAERRNAVLAEMASLAPDKSIVTAFRVKYDYHNVKAILKAAAMDSDPKHLLTEAGRVPAEKLLGAYQESRYVELPSVLGKAMEEARTVLARTANPQMADLILDQACYEEMKAAAREAECPFLEGYVQLLIDSTNLKSAVRTLRMHKDADFLQSVLLSGGSVSDSRIAAAGNAVTAYLKDAKLIGFGPETLAAYLAAVEGETTAVRMILTGRLAGIAPDTIRERLRDLYA